MKHTELRMVVAMVLSIVIFWAWSDYFMPQQETSASTTVAVTDTVTTAATETPGAAASQAPIAAAVPQQEIPVQTVTVATNFGDVDLSNDGGVPVRWQLPHYEDEAGAPINLIQSGSVKSLAMVLDGFGISIPALPRYQIERRQDNQVAFIWESPEIRIEKVYTFAADNYLATVEVNMANRTNRQLQGRISLGWQVENEEAESGILGMLRRPSDRWHPVYLKDGDVERIENSSDIGSGLVADGSILWGGLESRYFMAALLPRAGAMHSQFQASQEVVPGKGERLAVRFAGAPVVIPVGTSITQGFSVYVGPKDLKTLETVGSQLGRAVDFGWFSMLAGPIVGLLNFFYGVVHNYGIAIILLTLFIKALLHPITKKSMKSMRKMQQIQPEIAAIREKYKDKSEELNKATMELFKRHQVNPLGGCLPMVLQFPVYIALYRVLWNSVELYHAPFFGFYTDLSAPDPYFISPVVLAVFFILQQKLTPSPSADPMQKKMMMIMPLFFTAFLAFLPSGLVLYILVNTVFTVVQQWLMNRGLGFRDLFRGRLTPVE